MLLRAVYDIGFCGSIIIVFLLAVVTPVYALYNPRSFFGRKLYAKWPGIMPESVRLREAEHAEAAQRHLDEVTRRSTNEEELIQAPVGSVVDTGLDESEISGKIVFQSLRQFTGRKEDMTDTDPHTGERLPQYHWALQKNGQVRGQLPRKERGDTEWFLMDSVADQAAVDFVSYLDEYAKRFAQSDQKGHVQFSVPGIDGEWVAVDIVWTRVDDAGGSTFAHERDWMLFLTCKSATSEGWLIYGTRYRGQCKDVLYRSVSFSPEVDISSIL